MGERFVALVALEACNFMQKWGLGLIAEVG